MRNFIIAAMLLVMAACSQPQKQTEEKPDLKEQVMAVHDEVMPKMGELRNTQKQLMALLDSAGTDSLMAVKYSELAHNLKLANQSMMDWMHNYDPNFSGTDEEVKAYLEEQLISAKKVRENMLGSLEAGKKELEKQ